MSNISTKTKYVRIDGWRGYLQPINAVGGANDTGSWSDSPCPSHICKAEVQAFTKMLRKDGISYKTTSGGTSNVFCGKRYVLVAPEDRDRALVIAEEHTKDTRLFYTCD